MYIRQHLISKTAKTDKAELYLKLSFYYAILLLVAISGVAYGAFFSELTFPSYKPQWIEDILNALKIVWLIPLPYAVVNFYS